VSDNALHPLITALYDGTGSLDTRLIELMRLTGPDPGLASQLRGYWTEKGLGVRQSLKSERLLIDAFKHFYPIYEGERPTLYRGELQERSKRGLYGFAWTSKEAVARTFSDRLEALKEGAAVVLRIDVGSRAIVAGPSQHSVYLGEDEYLVDVRKAEVIL
jgi:hypothetical protein